METVKLEFSMPYAEILDTGSIGDVVIEQDITGDGTVRNLLIELSERYPRASELIFDKTSQRLLEGVWVFVNKKQLELLGGLDSKLKDGDVLSFVPIVAGG